jgi:hypothetical protein
MRDDVTVPASLPTRWSHRRVARRAAPALLALPALGVATAAGLALPHLVGYVELVGY